MFAMKSGVCVILNDTATTWIYTYCTPLSLNDALPIANDPWQLAQRERAFQRRQVRALCALGVRFADPARVDIRGEVTAEQDVEIDVDVAFEGRVALGEVVRIGPFCRIRNANLAAGTELRAHCDNNGARNQGAVQVGPLARPRPGPAPAGGAPGGHFL